MTTTTSIDGAIDGYELAQPRLHQRSAETQTYGTVTPMLPLDLEEPIRHEITEQLNQVLADTMTLRDLYKKSHWQVSGPDLLSASLVIRQALWRTGRTGGCSRREDSITGRA